MAKDSEKLGAFGRFKTIFPVRDNRPNEWSPMPTGVIIAAFLAPVGVIFLVGAAFDEDTGLSPFYGLMAFVCGVLAVWAMSDASYIAGMRRIANQDLHDNYKREKIKPIVMDEYPSISEMKKEDDQKNGTD